MESMDTRSLLRCRCYFLGKLSFLILVLLQLSSLDDYGPHTRRDESRITWVYKGLLIQQKVEAVVAAIHCCEFSILENGFLDIFKSEFKHLCTYALYYLKKKKLKQNDSGALVYFQLVFGLLTFAVISLFKDNVLKFHQYTSPFHNIRFVLVVTWKLAMEHFKFSECCLASRMQLISDYESMRHGDSIHETLLNNL
ncbi:DTW domain-containing protein [Striga asiatica]|uniref:DTW domain-containing protein n=1 Tax=Striga asiatica TaxID=4170 RepID=A0A5A7PX34_STRAF|nr:DTW domain-containing protein [Striga asiatica]